MFRRRFRKCLRRWLSAAMLLIILLSGSMPIIAQSAPPAFDPIADPTSEPVASPSTLVLTRSYEERELQVDSQPATGLQTIIVSNDLGCQYQYESDNYEMDPSYQDIGDCGTFLVVDGTLYAPDIGYWGTTQTTPIGEFERFTPVDFYIGGAGTEASPYAITTVVDAGQTGLRITQRDYGVWDQDTSITEIEITNQSGSDHVFTLYRAGDCYLGGNDMGYGYAEQTATGTAIGCTTNVSNAQAGYTAQWAPYTPGSNYFQASASGLWSTIGSHVTFPNNYDETSSVDNAAGLSWRQSVAGGGVETFEHATVFTAPRTPLIFVPGFTGSTLRDSESEIWPKECELVADPDDDHLLRLVTAEGELAAGVYTTNIIRKTNACGGLEDVYQGTLDELEKHGYELSGGEHNTSPYEEGDTLFVFPYNWLLSAEDNADLLIDRVEEVLNLTGSQQVDILTHSQGGIVALAALREIPQGTVRRVVTLAAPILGVAEGLGYLEYGWPCYLQWGDFDFVGELISDCVLDMETARDVIRYAPGAYEGLPSRRYDSEVMNPLTVVDYYYYPELNEQPRLPVSMAYNQWSRYIQYGDDGHLKAADNFHNTFDHLSADDLHAERIIRIYSDAYDTIGRILALYWDCKLLINACDDTNGGPTAVLGPLEVEGSEGWVDGDNFVPGGSANVGLDGIEALNATSLVSGGTQHDKIHLNPDLLKQIACFFRQVNLPASGLPDCPVLAPGGSSLQASADPRSLNAIGSGFELETLGPVAGYVEDTASGLVVGSYFGGSQPDEIPDATYHRLQNFQAFFLEDNAYTAQFIMVADGPFELQLRTTDGTAATGQALFRGRELSGALLSVSFAAGQVLGDLRLQIDRDGDGIVDEERVPDAFVSGAGVEDTTPPTVSAQTSGNKKVRVTLDATDDSGGSGVFATYYQVVGVDAEPQLYSSPFTLDIGALVLFQAIDGAGNSSPIQEIEIKDGVPADMTTSASIGGPAVTVTTTAPGQKGIISFDGVAGQQISAVLDAVTIGSSACCDADVSILNPDSTPLLPPSAVGTRGRTLSATLAQTGTYSIVVDPRTTRTGSATLTLYDTPDVTNTIAVGDSPVTLTTSVPGQRGVLSFSGSAGQEVSLNLTNVTIGSSVCGPTPTISLEPCGSRVSILNPDGSSLVAQENIGTDGDFFDRFVLPTSGTYTIMIDPYETNTGSLDLSLFDASEITATASIGGSAVPVTIGSPGQNASVTFDASANQLITLDVSAVTVGSSDCCGSLVEVIGPDGSPVIDAFWIGTPGGSASARVPSAGTYTIIVDPLQTNTGSVTLTVTETPDVTGVVVPDGQPVTVTITDPGQQAQLTFDGLAGQRVELAMSDVTIGSLLNVGTDLSVFNPDSSVLVGPLHVGTAGKTVDTQILPMSGTYTILLEPWRGRTGSATLTLTEDVSGSITIGGPPVDISINPPDEDATLSFVGALDQRIALDLTNITIEFGKVSILKPDGTELLAPASFGTHEIRNFFDDVPLLPMDGVYSIVVDPNDGYSGAVTLTLYDVPPDVTGTITPGDPPVDITLTYPGQNAVFTFQGTSGQRVSAMVTNVSGITLNQWGLTIDKPNGYQSSTNGTALVNVDLEDDGAYTITFDPDMAETGSLTLTLYEVVDYTGTITTDGVPLDLQLSTPGQDAYLTFDGLGDQRLSLDLSNVTINGSTWQGAKVSIRNPDGTDLISPTWFGTDGKLLDVPDLPVDGTYTLVIDPYQEHTGAVTIALTALADVEATIVPGGPAVTLDIVEVGQSARLTFDGVTGQRVSLDVTGMTIALSAYECHSDLEIRAPDGTVLTSDTCVQTAAKYYDTITLPADGAYTIVLDPDDQRTGSATFTLYDVPPDVSGSIAPGGAPVSVSLTVPGQNTALTFAGLAGQKVSLELGGMTIGQTAYECHSDLDIFNPDGTVLKSDTCIQTAAEYIDSVTLPVDGTYTINLDPDGNRTGDATLTLYDVPQDVSGSITPGGSPVTITTTAPGQNGQLTFSGSSGQRISLEVGDLTYTEGSFCCRMKISIQNPDGTNLQSATYMSSPGGGFIDVKTLGQSGTYSIVVDPQDMNTGSATLTLHDVPADVSGSISPSADGNPQTVTTTVPGQNGNLTFSGVTGQRVFLRFNDVTYSPSTSSCCRMKASVLNPDGTTLYAPNWIFPSGDYIDTLTLPVDGTYTILIDPNSNNTGSVTVLLYDVLSDVTGSLSIGGAALDVETTTPGQGAQISFSGTAGQEVNLQLTNSTFGPYESSCCRVQVSILNPDGSTLQSPTYVSTSGTTITKILGQTGSYTIVINPRNANIGGVRLTLTETVT